MSTDGSRTRALSLTAAGLLAAVVLFVVIRTSGLPAPTSPPPGSFSFAVLGDAPCYRHEEMQYRLLLKHIDAHDLAASFMSATCSGAAQRRDVRARSAKDDLAATERTAAAAAWIRETFANAGEASAVVLAFHARPPFIPMNAEYIKAYRISR